MKLIEFFACGIYKPESVDKIPSTSKRIISLAFEGDDCCNFEIVCCKILLQ